MSVRYRSTKGFGEDDEDKRLYFEALGVSVPAADALFSEDENGEEDNDDQEDLQSDLVV